jgi:hypothetical protein
VDSIGALPRSIRSIGSVTCGTCIRACVIHNLDSQPTASGHCKLGHRLEREIRIATHDLGYIGWRSVDDLGQFGLRHVLTLHSLDEIANESAHGRLRPIIYAPSDTTNELGVLAHSQRSY